MNPNNLINAIYRNDTQEVQRLLASGADANAVDSAGRTLLMLATLVEKPKRQIVESLIEAGAKIDAADAGRKWTAIHFAAQRGDLDLLTLFCQNRANIDLPDDSGNTPLWVAVLNSKSEDDIIPQLLLSHGANPRQKNHHGVSPLDLAMKLGHQSKVRLFTSQSNGG